MSNERSHKTGIETGRVSVYWINHGQYSEETHATLAEAVAYVRSKCFGASFELDGKNVGWWGPIAGLHLERGVSLDDPFSAAT